MVVFQVQAGCLLTGLLHVCVCVCALLSAAQVLTMLYDLEMSAISSRQLGQHAAHHLWRTIMQDLSAMQGMQLLLQQVRWAVASAAAVHRVCEKRCVWRCACGAMQRVVQ